MNRKLKLVEPPKVEPIDIQAKARAEIRARDWAAVHVAADRSKPVEIADRPRRKAWGWERWR